MVAPVEAPCEAVHVLIHPLVHDFKQKLIDGHLHLRPDNDLEAKRRATVICLAIQFCYGDSIRIINGQQTPSNNGDFEGNWVFNGQEFCELAATSLESFQSKINRKKIDRRLNDVDLHLLQVDIDVLRAVLNDALGII
ncbi:hypothetical protein C4579_04025 [Candidatus Microgenomates bacterium]|nr:MAG: hypothetical protein C4579_04025 [Candidatus Microgenomates bacterium]